MSFSDSDTVVSELKSPSPVAFATPALPQPSESTGKEGCLVSTKNWHLPSASTRIKSLATAAADCQHPLKGVQGGDQE